MNQNKGIVIRVKPTASQRAKLTQHFGCNRFLWNYFLNKRRTEYQENKQGSSYYRDAAELTKLKQQPEYAWMYETSVNSQQRTLKNLDDAYKRFFKGKARFPRFKSKRHDQAFTLAGGISVKGKRVCIPKFPEGLKFNRALPAYTKVNSVTVRKTASGLYYVILSVEADVQPMPANDNQVGIDLGLTDFAVFSNGKRIKAPKLFRKQQAALRRAQQHLSRKKKGSKRRDKQRIKVARIQEQIANARKDFLHKASAFAVKNFGAIAIEDLAVKNMVKNRSLSKSISDAGWGQFTTMLEYKAAWYGRELVKVGRFYPSSKSCGECGFIHQGLRLDERKWACPGCGAEHDRDHNASQNILREGLKQLSERQSPSTVLERASACA
jgi:putative transposase